MTNSLNRCKRITDDINSKNLAPTDSIEISSPISEHIFNFLSKSMRPLLHSCLLNGQVILLAKHKVFVRKNENKTIEAQRHREGNVKYKFFSFILSASMSLWFFLKKCRQEIYAGSGTGLFSFRLSFQRRLESRINRYLRNLDSRLHGNDQSI